jgi:hypothetical protein
VPAPPVTIALPRTVVFSSVAVLPADVLNHLANGFGIKAGSENGFRNRGRG